MIERAGRKAGFRFKTHPHMLRHACGYALAEKGYDERALQLYLGHRGTQYVRAMLRSNLFPGLRHVLLLLAPPRNQTVQIHLVV
jgi:integrase